MRPSSGDAEQRGTPSTSILLQRLEVRRVQAVELLADLEEEHAEDQHGHQHIQGDAELDDHRHAVGGAHGAEEQAVFHRQESDYLRHRLAARDHGENDSRITATAMPMALRIAVLARAVIGCARSKGEHHHQQADQHGAGDVQHRLACPSTHRGDGSGGAAATAGDHFERQRERRGNVKMDLVGA